ncbi:MAG: cytochrome c [Pedosphaera sp.]|nr:cytochrome c [Pedosphaera sp.]MST00447.1 cytochrome c [Pedosphaera sp.]
MRYVVLGLTLVAALVVSVLGFRGDTSRKPPLEIFPDMDRQPKLRPQEPNALLPNGRSSQFLVEGTVARGTPFAAIPKNTGRVLGVTNFVETLPMKITSQLLARGRDRYAISCLPCHGAQGDGNGITKKIGAMAVVANLHDARIVKLPDGELFHVISEGRNLMGGYRANVTIDDRWAIVAYLRALQRSRLAFEDELSTAERAQLK